MARRKKDAAGPADASSTAASEQPAPRRRGRPKGSKNKKPSARKARATKAAATPAPARRGPGRPKAAAAKATGAKRGRPAGSGLERRINALIKELESMRSQVQQLEQLRDAVKNIRV